MIFAYNTSKHQTTRVTPFALFHGRSPRLPLDVTCGAEYCPADKVCSASELAEIREKVVDAIKRAAALRAGRHESVSNQNQYIVGDFVWLHRAVRKKGLSPKLQRPWTGPYQIVEVLSPQTYRIRLAVAGKRTSLVVHHDRLKPCVVREDEAYNDESIVDQPVNRRPPPPGSPVVNESSPGGRDDVHDEGHEDVEAEYAILPADSASDPLAVRGPDAPCETVPRDVDDGGPIPDRSPSSPQLESVGATESPDRSPSSLQLESVGATESPPGIVSESGDGLALSEQGEPAGGPSDSAVPHEEGRDSVVSREEGRDSRAVSESHLTAVESDGGVRRSGRSRRPPDMFGDWIR